MSMHSVDRWENASQSAYVTTRSLAVTLTFDFLTSKSSQFISVPNCIKVVRLVNFSRAVYKLLLTLFDMAVILIFDLKI